MSLFSNIRAYVRQRRERRRYRETERLVNMLPLDIQKDIGWPDDARQARRR